jgi:hypothetical protein
VGAPRNPAGGVGLGFHTEDGYTPPGWPSRPGEQLMMGRLEIRVDDLEAACAHPRSCGVTLADFQPQEDIRVHRSHLGPWDQTSPRVAAHVPSPFGKEFDRRHHGRGIGAVVGADDLDSR